MRETCYLGLLGACLLITLRRCHHHLLTTTTSTKRTCPTFHKCTIKDVSSEGPLLASNASKSTWMCSGKVASMSCHVRRPGLSLVPACHMRVSHVCCMIGLLLSGTEGVFPKEECAMAGQGAYTACPDFYLALTAEVSTATSTT